MSDCCSGGAVEGAGEACSDTLIGFGWFWKLTEVSVSSGALLEGWRRAVGQLRFGHAAIREADHVVELLRLAAVDLQADAGRHQAAGRHRDLEHLAVHLALQLDQADAGDHLAGAGGDDVLDVADVDVFLLGAGLEPALRNLRLLLLRGAGASRRPESRPRRGHDRKAVALVFRLVMLSIPLKDPGRLDAPLFQLPVAEMRQQNDFGARVTLREAANPARRRAILRRDRLWRAQLAAVIGYGANRASATC